jgi:hypothetical protein
MSNLLGLHGYNKTNGTEELIAVWQNSPRVYNSGTGGWTNAGLSLTNNTKAEMRTFLDQVFLTNGVDANYNYDGSTWSTTTNLNSALIGTYVENYNVRLYLGNIKISGVAYPSRTWYSDFPKSNGTLVWGIQAGSDLEQTISTDVVTSVGALFLTNGIKIGDPFTITSGDNAGQYTVKFITSETSITLTTTLGATATNSSYWAGSNYFDVATDDGDSIVGYGKNSSELLIFKRNSLHKYNSTGGELRQVKGAPGTTSRRSIVNLADYTFYFYPDGGIYMYDGIRSTLISSAVDDIINGMSSANYTEVVAWVEKQRRACFYIGDTTLNDGTTISNCIIVYDVLNNTWSTKSYGLDMKAAAVWLESNIPNVYVGNELSQVHKISTGTDFNGSPISFQLETHPIFPAGYNSIVDFSRMHLFMNNGPFVQALYKLVYKPTYSDKEWTIDSNWQPLMGSSNAEKVELTFPEGSRASGVILKFVESSTKESFLIEKVTLYYSNVSNI